MSPWVSSLEGRSSAVKQEEELEFELVKMGRMTGGRKRKRGEANKALRPQSSKCEHSQESKEVPLHFFHLGANLITDPNYAHHEHTWNAGSDRVANMLYGLVLRTYTAGGWAVVPSRWLLLFLLGKRVREVELG